MTDPKRVVQIRHRLEQHRSVGYQDTLYLLDALDAALANVKEWAVISDECIRRAETAEAEVERLRGANGHGENVCGA